MVLLTFGHLASIAWRRSFDEGQQLFRRQRPAYMVTLCVVTAHLRQSIPNGLTLHPFGDDRFVQPVRHPDIDRTIVADSALVSMSMTNDLSILTPLTGSCFK